MFMRRLGRQLSYLSLTRFHWRLNSRSKRELNARLAPSECTSTRVESSCLLDGNACLPPPLAILHSIPSTAVTPPLPHPVLLRRYSTWAERVISVPIRDLSLTEDQFIGEATSLAFAMIVLASSSWTITVRFYRALVIDL